MAEGLYGLGNFTFLLTLILLHLPLTFQRPQSADYYKKDHVALRTASGKIKYWHLRKCPDEYGLSFEYVPGKIYPAGIKIACVPCVEGKTYSDIEDYSQCKNCTQCKEHEMFTGQCQMGKDEIHCTGQCQEGFYWSNVTYSCISCSECCDRNGNNSGCTKRCSQELSKINCTLVKNATESSVRNDTGGEKKPEKGEGNNGTPKVKEEKSTSVISIFLSVLGAVVVIVFVLVCTWLHAGRCVQSCCNERQYFDQQSSGELMESVVENSDNTDPKQCGFAKSVASSAESTGLLNNADKALNSRQEQFGFAKSVASSAESAGLPSQIDKALNSLLGKEIPQDDTGEVDEKNDTLCPYGAESSVQAVAVSKVRDIQKEKMQKICELLDEREIYFRDYRMLGEILGVEKSEKDQLDKSSTTCILHTYQNLDLEDFCNALKECSRGDIVSIIHGNSKMDPEPQPPLAWEKPFSSKPNFPIPKIS